MNINVITPYDDNSLQFNQDSGRYELTTKYCRANFTINFADDGILERRIKKNTRNVYSFIFSRVATTNKQVVDFMLKRTEEGRKFLLDILSAQMEADIDSGYNDLAMTSPVNLSNGQVIPREEIKRNQVSVATEQIFENSDDYFGFRLGYTGMFPAWLFMFVRNNL